MEWHSALDRQLAELEKLVTELSATLDRGIVARRELEGVNRELERAIGSTHRMVMELHRERTRILRQGSTLSPSLFGASNSASEKRPERSTD